MGITTSIILTVGIHSKKKELNQINADIEKYQKAIEDAKKASELFVQFISGIDELVDETSYYFKGTAAPEFRLRLLKSSSFISDRDIDMQHKVNYFQNCISNLEDRRRDCEKSIDTLRALTAVCLFSVV